MTIKFVKLINKLTILKISLLLIPIFLGLILGVSGCESNGGPVLAGC